MRLLHLAEMSSWPPCSSNSTMAISYFFSKIWGTMFACFLFIVASMAIQCHGLPNIDQDSGFILNKILQVNLGKS